MELIKSAAIHEAAHVVFTYCTGHKPLSVCVTPDGNGATNVDYGQLNKIAAILMNSTLDENFTLFLRTMKQDLAEFAQTLCQILLAGGVAEAIDRDGLSFDGTSLVEIAGPDLTRAETISRHFKIDLQEELAGLYECVREEHFWNAISVTSDAILKSPSNQLDQQQIEAILQGCGFINFLMDE